MFWKKKQLISDDGYLQKPHYSDRAVIVTCSIMSLVLVYLGFMAYFAG